MSDIAEGLKDYLQTHNYIITQLSYYEEPVIQEIEARTFPRQSRVPYKCSECEHYYAVDGSVSILLDRIGKLKCTRCSNQLNVVILPTRSPGITFRGVGDEPMLDMQSVYSNREDIEKYGDIRPWHEKLNDH